MAGLKIAMINGIKPIQGGGDGITEYAYRMYLQMKEGNDVDLIYSIDRARKNDMLGLIKVNSMLSSKAKEAGGKRYDIFHVVNQEVGFAAKDVKSVRKDNKVITTIHDIARFQPGVQKGTLQKAYNQVVRRNVAKAVDCSDFLMFDSNQTMKDVKARFGNVQGRVVSIGIDGRFMAKIPARKKHRFVVGYLGSFAYHKNAIMVLQAANLLKGDEIDFRIYGIGSEARRISDYKRSHRLSNVKLLGFADERRKLQIYDGFDAFAFPSLYEGFGLPVLDAQARGLPVVIYERGRISEEIARYCFKARDEEHMAEIIESIKENGYNYRMRKQAMEYARSFTWERCARETAKVYNKILDL